MTELALLILAVAYFARRGRGKTLRVDALPALLAGAESAGIISADQREQLLAYARTQEPTTGRLGGAAWLGVFAGLFVVAGVSLLIARNWEDIGPLFRVGAFTVLLAGTGLAAIRFRDAATAVSLPLELVWFFLPLLGIGLYGQTFNLSGDPITPFLVWLVLTTAIAWLSPRAVTVTIHTFAMVAVLFAGNFLLEPAGFLLSTGTPSNLLALTERGGGPLAWTLSLVLLAAIVAQSLARLPRTHRHQCVGVVLAWIFAILVATEPFRLRHEAWIVLAALALATLWIVIQLALDTSIEERGASVAIWLALIYALTFSWHFDRPASGEATTAGMALVGLVTLAAIAGTLVLPGRRLSPRPAWANGARALLLAPLAVAVLYFSSDPAVLPIAGGLMNLLLLAIAVASMWHGSLVREPAQVNLGVVVLVGLLITRFLDLFGSMLRSGVGFIVAGVLLAALSWALERTRRRLIAGSSEVAP